MTKVHASRLAPELERQIRSIVGVKNFLIDKIGITDVLNQRSRSRTIIFDDANRSDFSAVVLPETTEQVSEVVSALYDSGVAMVPYGAGTGLMGGVLSLNENVCVSMKKMKKILNVDKVEKTFVAQSGVILGDLEKELNRSRMILGHDPWSRSYATLGGSIASDGIGYLGGRLGSIRNQVLGLEVVLPNGEIIRTKAVAHSSAGIDLKQIFIGSEGTLGLITEATMRAYPYPERTRIIGYRFENFQKGHKAVLALHAKGVCPSSLDLDENRRNITDPRAPGETRLHLVFSGLRGEVDALQKEAQKIISRFAKSRISKTDTDQYWAERHKIADMVLGGRRRRHRTGNGSSFDYLHVSLPANTVSVFRKRCLELAKTHGVEVVSLGLWHGPNMFSSALHADGANSLESRQKLQFLLDHLLKYAQTKGGSMEYCHGVGVKLVHLMGSEHGNSLELMKAIKNTIDPKGLMNPGKVFPRSQPL